MSSSDANTTSSTSATSSGTTAASGVSLGSTLDSLLYFNGRFLKAEDLKLEQAGYLTRIALSERAQGAGVSYGFHVTTATSVAPSQFVDSVAEAVVGRMKASPREWVEFLNKPDPANTPPSETVSEGHADEETERTAVLNPDLARRLSTNLDTALVHRLAGALHTLCGADPGNASGVVFTIGPGHAADGFGHDLLLDSPNQVKLSKLIEAFTTAPTAADAPGPVVTPRPMTSAPPLTGAFLLTIRAHDRDHGNVPVYGVQCTDAKTAVCSLGYRSCGVSAQLVFFDALGGAAQPSEWWQWRGQGARAYFDKEVASRSSRLPDMLAALPFSSAAQAPETGTHVPIGMVYLYNGSFMTFDPWTAKRLRSPGELTYWLRTLRYPPQVSRLARVLQFQSQLTDALSGGVAGGAKSLWKLGFSEGAELVLPGVGFLSVPPLRTKDGASTMTADALATTLDAYFDGVPYQIVEASEGEMNALFVGVLESGALRLKRKVLRIGIDYKPLDDLSDRLISTLPSDATADEKATLRKYLKPIDWPSLLTTRDLIGPAVTAELAATSMRAAPPVSSAPPAPAQVFVWFTPDPFPGHVMFTWPAPQPTAVAAAPPRAYTHVRLANVGAPENTFVVVGHDGEWATYCTSVLGRFFDLRALRVELERPFSGLELHCELVLMRDEVEVKIDPKDGWFELPTEQGAPQHIAVRIWLSGAESNSYSVLYRVRLRVGDSFYIDSPTFQDSDLLPGDPRLWSHIPKGVFASALNNWQEALKKLGLSTQVQVYPEAIWVSIVPRRPAIYVLPATGAAESDL